jgi:hypothetical protein
VFARFFAHIEQKTFSNGVCSHFCSHIFARKFDQSIYAILVMDESDMDVFGKFLHGSYDDDYEDDDYSRLQVQIGDGPPSEIIRERRGRLLPNQIII